MTKKPTRTLAQARKGIQPSEDYSPPLGFADDDLEDYSPTLDDEEDDDIPQVINPPKRMTPEERKRKVSKQEQRSLRAKKGARTRRLNRGLKEGVIRTSVALTPTLLGQVRSMGRGVSPVVREALQEYLERRGILPAGPQTIEQLKGELRVELEEQFGRKLEKQLEEKLEKQFEEKLEKQLEEKLKAELASRKRRRRKND